MRRREIFCLKILLCYFKRILTHSGFFFGQN